ncbi:LacI family DNA-binding transcriptional regulator, partial [Escherichia coli]|nr:LacI family DNA-binding transcriptional regulator [Escherichia coli]
MPIWLLVGENRGGIGDNCPGIIVIFYCIAVSGDRALDLASDVCFCYSARFTANGLGMASLKDVARLAGVSMMTVS